MEIISSLQNSKIRDAVRLHTSRGRKRQGRIIVFGVREVQRAVAANVPLVSVFVDADQANSTAIKQLRQDCAADFYAVEPPVYEKLSYGDRGDGVVAVADRPGTALGSFSPGEGLLVIAESIEKPGNLGAICRSADAAAVGGLIVADPVCDLFHPNAIRNSTGTAFSVPNATSTTMEAIDWLHENNYRVLVATPHQAQDLYSIEYGPRTAIVLGNEARGLSSPWMDGPFERICLTMDGVADSLNVSVTAAVMMFEAVRQRSSKET